MFHKQRPFGAVFMCAVRPELRLSRSTFDHREGRFLAEPGSNRGYPRTSGVGVRAGGRERPLPARDRKFAATPPHSHQPRSSSPRRRTRSTRPGVRFRSGVRWHNPLNSVGIHYKGDPKRALDVRKRLGIVSVSVDDRDARKRKSYASLSLFINNLDSVRQ